MGCSLPIYCSVMHTCMNSGDKSYLTMLKMPFFESCLSLGKYISARKSVIRVVAPLRFATFIYWPAR